MERRYKNSVPWEEVILEKLQDEEFAKGYLNHSFMNYVEDGDFKMFFKALERVVKARTSVSKFAEKAELDRVNLNAIFKGRRDPKLRTVLKILSNLGYTFKVA